MIALTMTLALAPWFASPSIKRWMPTSTPYAAQEIAMVSSAPAGSGLPIGLMPGALPSDQASRHRLNTTAMRLPPGQVQSCRFQSGLPTFRHHALTADIECGDRGHVDDLRIVGPKRHDLHRTIESDQHRTDYSGAAKLHQHLGRDRGGVESRHDQNVGRAGQAAERISLTQFHIQRDVGGHFAVVLEVDALLVQKPHRL